MSINAKVFEKQFNDELSKLIYAHYKDITSEWNNDLPYTDDKYQNYANLLLDKKARQARKARFTISSEAKQYLVEIYKNVVNELGEIEINDADVTLQGLIDQLKENEESFAAFIFELGGTEKHKFGKTLIDARDPKDWFQGQLTGSVKSLVVNKVAAAIVGTAFNQALKALACNIGSIIWYTKVSVSGDLFLGILKFHNMNQMMIDTVAGCLRPKAPSKPKKKATDKATESKPTETTPTKCEDEEEEDAEYEDDEDETPVTTDGLNAMLGKI
jgi:hypothetical protein